MLTGYAELTASLGLDPHRLASSVGLHLADLDAPDRWLPAGAAARLLEVSARLSGCADFGLRLAAHRQLGTLGPLSVAIRDEPTLGAALDLLIRYRHTYNEALHMRLHAQGELTSLVMWLEFGEPAPVRQASDLAMGAHLGIIRALVGLDWMPESASFTHDAPDDPTPYVRLWGPRLRFEHDVTELQFRTTDLGTEVLTSDASLRPYTREFLLKVVPPGAETAAAQVTEVVELLLPLGTCSVEEVGRQLGLSPRELRRRLAQEGESFSSIVGATRACHAERHLQDGRRSLTEISQLLGFAAPSAFSRWFAQRFGTSPSAWRIAARTPSAAVPYAASPAGAPSS
jgi:AraC-like DNA-binding protein